MDSLLRRFQIGLYTCSIFLVSIPVVSINIAIIQLFFSVTSLAIKLFRQIRNKNAQVILQAQIGFYIPYLMTGFQIAFLMQSNKQLPLYYVENTLSVVVLAVLTVNYSLVTKKQIISKQQTLMYSIGIVLQMIDQVHETIFTVKFFDTIYDNEYIKDFLLLETATAIAVGGLILDLIQRAKQQKNKENKDI